MGMNLKTCFFSLAALVSVAARADGAATSPAQDDPAAVSAQRTAHAQYGDTHAMNEAAPCPQHAMSSADEAAVGSASGEPKRQGTLDDWNHLEFLRNTWDTP